MVRALKLFAVLLACDFHMLLTRGNDLPTRSRNRRVWSQRAIRAIGMSFTVNGTPPKSGMIAGNHLSYLDILTYGAVMDGIFVSKEEVGRWPLVGLATRLAGTIYINRRSRSALTPVNAKAAEVLRSGLVVTFFPEGTSSDGSSVLRFHPGLFQAAVETGAPIWPSSITYHIDGSSEGVGEKVCYWGKASFVPHILRFLQLPNVSAELRFAAEPIHATDRVEAAQLTQAAVAELAGLPIASKEASTAVMQSAIDADVAKYPRVS